MFWLKYLFIHQKQEITYLFYYNYKDLHILLSSSKDGSICCYNIDNGELIYTFNISDYIKYACFCKEIPKSKRIIPKTHITLLCNSPRKIFLNLTKEKPINMNTYDFNYNDFTKIIYINNNFYLLGKRGNCIVFNNNFEDEKKVLYHKAIPLYDIIQFKKYFVIFTSDFNMVLVDFNFDLSRMIELFYIKFGMNRVTNLIYINNILYITNADKNIYSIDVNTEYELYEERIEMIKEDKFCDAFNVFYELHKNKRKKKKKGKKGKGKKKSASPAKKKASPAKKKKK
jgi:outer membrane protein assembly factor BamB